MNSCLFCSCVQGRHPVVNTWPTWTRCATRSGPLPPARWASTPSVCFIHLWFDLWAHHADFCCRVRRLIIKFMWPETKHEVTLNAWPRSSLFFLSGIWPDGADGTDINAVCRSHDGSLLTSADDFGKVHLFSFPCCQPRVSRSQLHDVSTSASVSDVFMTWSCPTVPPSTVLETQSSAASLFFSASVVIKC